MLFSRSAMSGSLWLRGLWHTGFLCLSPSQSLPRLMPIESVMPSSHLILCSPLLLLPSIFLHQGLFQWVSSLHQVASVLELQLQHVNHEIPDVQAGFREGRGTREEIANICWIIEKAREFEKNIYSALLTMPEPLTVWITINCGKFWKRWKYQTT